MHFACIIASPCKILDPPLHNTHISHPFWASLTTHWLTHAQNGGEELETNSNMFGMQTHIHVHRLPACIAYVTGLIWWKGTFSFILSVQAQLPVKTYQDTWYHWQSFFPMIKKSTQLYLIHKKALSLKHAFKNWIVCSSTHLEIFVLKHFI